MGNENDAIRGGRQYKEDGTFINIADLIEILVKNKVVGGGAKDYTNSNVLYQRNASITVPDSGSFAKYVAHTVPEGKIWLLGSMFLDSEIAGCTIAGVFFDTDYEIDPFVADGSSVREEFVPKYGDMIVVRNQIEIYARNQSGVSQDLETRIYGFELTVA